MMNRRDFLKPLGAAALAATSSRFSLSQEAAPPPFAEKVPDTPFDAPAGSWTLAVFPDTQNLARLEPRVLERQSAWVVAHRESHHIHFVTQLGDITDNNVPAEWKNAQTAFTILRDGNVAFSLLPGNHDLGERGHTADRSTLMNDYFKPADYKNSPKVHYFEEGRVENTAHNIETPWGKFLFISLEFGPRDAALDWASQLAAQHADHTVAVSSHAHLYYDSNRYDWAKYGKKQTWNPKDYAFAKDAAAVGGVNDGEDVWQKLLSRHENIRYMFNGHVLGSGTGYRVDEGVKGQRVHQMLANYQMGVGPARPYHGGGYFRLLRFLPDKKTIQVKTYSPWLDNWLTEPNQQFEITV